MITLEQAKVHLRIDGNHEDADIEERLAMASAIVGDYVALQGGDSVFGPRVMDAATLLVLGELYANREAHADPISPTVRALLQRQRMPGDA